MDCNIICVNLIGLLDSSSKSGMYKFFFYLGGEITYYGIVWRDNTEYVTARYDLITEIHVSVAYQM